MLSTTTVQVYSLTLDILGQVAMLVLIGTLLLAKSLPQRENPFLLNFFIVTFITGIPPLLLFFSGHLGRDPPEWLCSTQAILIDGVSPMCGFAWFIVVLHTLTDLKATLIGGMPMGKRSFIVKILLVALPYFAFLAWGMASLAAAMFMPPRWQLSHLIFCANESVLGVQVRQSIGFFLFFIGALQFILEILIARLIYQSWNIIGHPHTSFPFAFAFRVLVFCVAQLVPMILSVVNSMLFPRYIPIKQVTQMLVSTNAFATFLVFGTQRHVLHAWKFWDSNHVSPAAELKEDNKPGPRDITLHSTPVSKTILDQESVVHGMA